VLTPRMAAVPARHTQIMRSQFTFSEVFARAERSGPPQTPERKVRAQLWGVEFGTRSGGILPFGPGNAMNYTTAPGLGR
jgi:hypothetical protein